MPQNTVADKLDQLIALQKQDNAKRDAQMQSQLQVLRQQGQLAQLALRQQNAGKRQTLEQAHSRREALAVETWREDLQDMARKHRQGERASRSGHAAVEKMVQKSGSRDIGSKALLDILKSSGEFDKLGLGHQRIAEREAAAGVSAKDYARRLHSSLTAQQASLVPALSSFASEGSSAATIHAALHQSGQLASLSPALRKIIEDAAKRGETAESLHGQIKSQHRKEESQERDKNRVEETAERRRARVHIGQMKADHKDEENKERREHETAEKIAHVKHQRKVHRLASDQREQRFSDSAAQQEQREHLEEQIKEEKKRAQMHSHFRHAGLSALRGDVFGAVGSALEGAKGFDGKFGSAAGPAFAALMTAQMGGHALAGGMNTMARMADIHQDRFASNQQKADQTISALPGIAGELGRAFVNLRRSLDGTNQAIISLHQNLGKAGIQASAMQQITATYERGQIERQGGEARVLGLGQAVAGAQATGARLIAAAGHRDTYEGELEYQRQATLAGPEAALRRARAEEAAAQKRFDAADKFVREGPGEDVEVGGRRLDVYKGGAAGVERALTHEVMLGQVAEHARTGNVTPPPPITRKGFWGGAIDTAYGLRRTVRQALGIDRPQGADQAGVVRGQEGQAEGQLHALGQIAAQKDAINAKDKEALALAQAKKNTAQQEVNILKAHQQLLQQTEHRQATAAQSLGRMSPWKRQAALRGVHMMKKGMPLWAIPQGDRSAMESIAPEYMHKKYEEAGANSKEFKQLQEAGLVDKGSLSGTRKQIETIRAEANVKVELNEKAFAQAVTSAIVQKFEQILSLIQKEYDLKMKQHDTNQYVRSATSHP